MHATRTEFRRTTALKVVRSYRHRPSVRVVTKENIGTETRGHSQEAEWEDVHGQADHQTLQEDRVVEKSGQSSQEESVTGDTVALPRGFMRLPLELREEVYSQLMADLPPVITLRKKVAGSPLTYLRKNTLPSLAFVNHQIFNEVALAYIRRTKLQAFGYGNQLLSFFDFLCHFTDNQGFKSIRDLAFIDSISEFANPYRLYLTDGCDIAGTVMRCTGLTQLTLTIQVYKLLVVNDDFEDPDDLFAALRLERMKTPKEVEEEFGLTELWDLSGSFKLILVLKNAMASLLAEKLGRQPETLWDEFIQAFRGEIQKRGSQIKLHVEIED